MPITKSNSLKSSVKASKKYSEVINTWLTFEYVLIKNCNDDPSDGDRLIKILKGINKCKLNLIPYNETDGIYQRPDEKKINLCEKIK